MSPRCTGKYFLTSRASTSTPLVLMPRRPAPAPASRPLRLPAGGLAASRHCWSLRRDSVAEANLRLDGSCPGRLRPGRLPAPVLAEPARRTRIAEVEERRLLAAALEGVVAARREPA